MLVFKCQKPRFTRPIGADVQKLALPKAFVRQSDIGGLDKVTVTVPSGKEWEMRLRKSDREVSLAVGWQEFVNFYSLKRGYMLEFTYEGDSKFSVIIYDATLCEILYPMPMMNEESKDSDESSTLNDDDYPDQSSDSQSKANEGSDDSTHSESNQSDSSISVPGKK